MLLLMYIVELITLTSVTDVAQNVVRGLFLVGILCYTGHAVIEL